MGFAGHGRCRPGLVDPPCEGLVWARMDGLKHLWAEQARQQRELGLDPSELNDLERRRVSSDLLLQLHEEVSEIGRLQSGYKRHLLRLPHFSQAALAEEC